MRRARFRQGEDATPTSAVDPSLGSGKPRLPQMVNRGKLPKDGKKRKALEGTTNQLLQGRILLVMSHWICSPIKIVDFSLRINHELGWSENRALQNARIWHVRHDIFPLK
jgi:hypothetical protein